MTPTIEVCGYIPSCHSSLTANTVYGYRIQVDDHHKDCSADTVVETVFTTSIDTVNAWQTVVRLTGSSWEFEVLDPASEGH